MQYVQLKQRLKEGVVAGGGVALAQATFKIRTKTPAEEIVLNTLSAPYQIIMRNAGLSDEIGV